VFASSYIVYRQKATPAKWGGEGDR
jgi:hypothetical protein